MFLFIYLFYSLFFVVFRDYNLIKRIFTANYIYSCLKFSNLIFSCNISYAFLFTHITYLTHCRRFGLSIFAVLSFVLYIKISVYSLFAMYIRADGSCCFVYFFGGFFFVCESCVEHLLLPVFGVNSCVVPWRGIYPSVASLRPVKAAGTTHMWTNSNRLEATGNRQPAESTNFTGSKARFVAKTRTRIPLPCLYPRRPLYLEPVRQAPQY